MATARKPDHLAGLEKVRQATHRPRCFTCNDEAAPTVKEVVEAVKKKWAPLKVVYAYIDSLHPGFIERVRYSAFRLHVIEHCGYKPDPARGK